MIKVMELLRYDAQHKTVKVDLKVAIFWKLKTVKLCLSNSM